MNDVVGKVNTWALHTERVKLTKFSNFLWEVYITCWKVCFSSNLFFRPYYSNLYDPARIWTHGIRTAKRMRLAKMARDWGKEMRVFETLLWKIDLHPTYFLECNTIVWNSYVQISANLHQQFDWHNPTDPIYFLWIFQNKK